MSSSDSESDDDSIPWGYDYGEFVAYVRRHPQNAKGYVALAQTTMHGEIADLGNGKRLDKTQVLVEAIRVASTYGPQEVLLEARADLACHLLEKKSSTTLHDGRIVDAKQLFLECIETDPNKEESHRKYLMCQLAQSCYDDRHTQIVLDGQTLSAFEVCRQASSTAGEDIMDEDVYRKLASWMTADETVQVNDGKTYTRDEIFEKAESIRAWQMVKTLNLWFSFSKGKYRS